MLVYGPWKCRADMWSIFRLVYLTSKAGSLVCLASKTSHTFVLYSLQECEVEGKIILSYDMIFFFPFSLSLVPIDFDVNLLGYVHLKGFISFPQ